MRSDENRNDKQEQITDFDQLPLPHLEPEPEFAPPEEADLPPEDAGDLFRDSHMTQSGAEARLNPFAPASGNPAANPFGGAGSGLSNPSPFSTVGSNAGQHRSEEHTSELQSRFDLVCRLLL